MRMKNKGLKWAAISVATLLTGTSLSAQIIYQNDSDPVGANGTVTGDAPLTGSTSYEIGDTVTFAPGNRILDNFAFEYFVNGNGNETATLFLRAMDGPNGVPGTVLYDSGSVLLTQGSHQIGSPPDAFGTLLPETITWSVLFGGIDAGETSGLYFYNPGGPDVGVSPNFDTASGTYVNPPAGTDYYFRNNNGTWQLVGTGNLDNLGARFVAVPEPSTWALLLGGLGIVGYMARRRKM